MSHAKHSPTPEALRVACPQCGASIAHPCVDRLGMRSVVTHEVREDSFYSISRAAEIAGAMDRVSAAERRRLISAMDDRSLIALSESGDAEERAMASVEMLLRMLAPVPRVLSADERYDAALGQGRN